MARKPLKVVLLGTGGPRPDPDRHGPGTLIRYGEENILFDAGRGVVLQLLSAGISLAHVNPVFITHHHFDHIGDLHDVILSTWLQGRKGALRIFGPPETKRIVNALLTQVYDKDIEFRDQGEPAIGGWKPVEGMDVEAGLVMDAGDWRVSCEYVVHGHGLPLSPAFKKRWICLGYRFECEDGVVAISGDTIDCGGLDRLARNADLLVQCCYLAASEISDAHWKRTSELTLACADTVGKIATRNNVKALALTHHRQKPSDVVGELEEDIRKDFGGRLIIGGDLTVVDVA